MDLLLRFTLDENNFSDEDRALAQIWLSKIEGKRSRSAKTDFSTTSGEENTVYRGDHDANIYGDLEDDSENSSEATDDDDNSDLDRKGRHKKKRKVQGPGSRGGVGGYGKREYDDNGKIVRKRRGSAPEFDEDGNPIVRRRGPKPKKPKKMIVFDDDGVKIETYVDPILEELDEDGNPIPRKRQRAKPQYDENGVLIKRPRAPRKPKLDEDGNVIPPKPRAPPKRDADGNIIPPKPRSTRKKNTSDGDEPSAKRTKVQDDYALDSDEDEELKAAMKASLHSNRALQAKAQAQASDEVAKLGDIEDDDDPYSIEAEDEGVVNL